MFDVERLYGFKLHDSAYSYSGSETKEETAMEGQEVESTQEARINKKKRARRSERRKMVSTFILFALDGFKVMHNLC